MLATISSLDLSRSIGLPCGWGTCHGESMNTSTPLPSGVGEVDRPGVAVGQRPDATDLGLLLEDTFQVPEIVESARRTEGEMVHAVRASRLIAGIDEGQLMMVVGRLGQKDDLGAVGRAERATVGDLETEDHRCRSRSSSPCRRHRRAAWANSSPKLVAIPRG